MRQIVTSILMDYGFFRKQSLKPIEFDDIKNLNNELTRYSFGQNIDEIFNNPINIIRMK
jgi:hypothetical protein